MYLLYVTIYICNTRSTYQSTSTPARIQRGTTQKQLLGSKTIYTHDGKMTVVSQTTLQYRYVNQKSSNCILLYKYDTQVHHSTVIFLLPDDFHLQIYILVPNIFKGKMTKSWNAVSLTFRPAGQSEAEDSLHQQVETTNMARQSIGHFFSVINLE